MIAVTQDEIDEAVLIGKNAVYKLAAEIALERKYGGKTDCCTKRLKLIYTVLQPLLCVKTGNSVIDLATAGVPGVTYSLIINNVLLTEFTAPAFNSSAVTTFVDWLNTLGSDYEFSTITIPGQDPYGIRIESNSCETFVVILVDNKLNYKFKTSYGGYCLDCLDNDTVRKLISKIRAFCTT